MAPMRHSLDVPARNNPSVIKNKAKRTEVYGKLKAKKKKMKKDARKKREQEAKELGDDAPAKEVPRTQESTRAPNETFITGDDDEVAQDDAEDEFAPYFSNEKNPKIMITTRPRPSKELFKFIGDLMVMFPKAFLYKRDHWTLKQICEFAGNKGFTHLVVLSEKSKVCNGMTISHLPVGPTAFFKISNVVPSGKIRNSGQVTSHQPEIILNNFNTRLGHRTGRLLGSLFPHQPEFEGRQVATFHNQRDYIFVRHHRYKFDSEKKARLQELGPRFTMKMRWLLAGTFDTKHGEYEWVHKRKAMDVTRTTFHV